MIFYYSINILLLIMYDYSTDEYNQHTAQVHRVAAQLTPGQLSNRTDDQHSNTGRPTRFSSVH